MRRVGVLLACLAVTLLSVAVYQGYQGTVRDLDMLGSYSITQEMSPAMLDYHTSYLISYRRFKPLGRRMVVRIRPIS